MLDDYPRNFITLIHEKNLRFSDLKGDSQSLAYWYDSVIKLEGWKGNPVLDDLEKESIRKYVQSKDGFYSNKSAEYYSGRNIAKYISRSRKAIVSDEVYEDLLISLDHEISSTSNLKLRYSLIRDKIMFAYARICNLNLKQISLTTLDDISSSSYKSLEVSFYKNAKIKTLLMPGLIGIFSMSENL